MCELFGFCSVDSRDLTGLLREFYSHSPNHPNGWGLAIFHGGGVSIEKEPVCANESRYLQCRLEAPVAARMLLAHIRKASVGAQNYLNCHPFQASDAGGRCWTLMHNGTIFSCPALEKYIPLQPGSTDSERVLLFLVENIDRLEQRLGRPATARERAACVDESIAAVAPGNRLNLLIHDGEQFYVHCNVDHAALPAQSLFWLRRPGAVTVSTKPLTDGPWEEVPLSTLFAFRDGEEVFRGEDRHHVFVPPAPAPQAAQ